MEKHMEKDDYRMKIIDMVKRNDSLKFLESIYWFAKSALKNSKNKEEG